VWVSCNLGGVQLASWLSGRDTRGVTRSGGGTLIKKAPGCFDGLQLGNRKKAADRVHHGTDEKKKKAQKKKMRAGGQAGKKLPSRLVNYLSPLT